MEYPNLLNNEPTRFRVVTNGFLFPMLLDWCMGGETNEAYERKFAKDVLLLEIALVGRGNEPSLFIRNWGIYPLRITHMP